jgi:MraZ protein
VKFLDRVNFFGQVAEFDPQGRVLIPPRLRESAQMTARWMCSGSRTFSRSGTTTGSSRA